MSTQDPVEKWGARVNPKGHDKHEKEARSLNNLLLDAVDQTFLPAIDVDGVVHMPSGAHPASCGNRYSIDDAHLKEYLEASKEERIFKSYLDKYVHSASD